MVGQLWPAQIARCAPTFCTPMQTARLRIRPCAAKPYATGLCAMQGTLQTVLQSAARDAARPAESAVRRKALQDGALRDAHAREPGVRF
jgi:hypothetical protein